MDRTPRRSASFLTNNTRSVIGALHERDKENFDFDIGKLDWESYLQDVHIPGVKKYLLGMDPEAQGQRRPRFRCGIRRGGRAVVPGPPVDQVLGESFVPSHELGDQVVDGFPV